jgi:hypothetical protein
MSGLRKAVGLLAVAGVLWSAPAASQWILGFPPGRWEFEVKRDKITDLPFYLAKAHTKRAVIAGRRGDYLVGIGLSCFKGKGAFGVRWSASAAGSKNLVLEFRFDGQPGYRTEARYVNRSEQETTSVDDVRQFLHGANRSEGLYVRVTSDLYGVSEAYFVVRGGRDIVNKFRAACPAMLAEP